jgi:hypothetical protein
MRSIKQALTVTLALLMGISSPAFAQQHVVDPSAVAAGVAQHIATEVADRDSVRDALARPEVRQTAESMGVDLGRLAATVDTMSGPELQRAASLSRQLDQPLVGGASVVVISTTTIIIVLLLIVILVMIAD